MRQQSTAAHTRHAQLLLCMQLKAASLFAGPARSRMYKGPPALQAVPQPGRMLSSQQQHLAVGGGELIPQPRGLDAERDGLARQHVQRHRAAPHRRLLL